MDSVFEKIIEKTSSYNIFNFILPGAVFVYISRFLFNKDFLTNSWIENIIICYFIGMVLSRIGSLIIEPILKKCKLKYAPYPDYIEASKDDSKIPMLLETNNMYRTFIATFFSLVIYKCYLYLEQFLTKVNSNVFNEIKAFVLLIALTALFIVSFVKQTGYIRKRVEAYKKRKADSSQSSIITR